MRRVLAVVASFAFLSAAAAAQTPPKPVAAAQGKATAAAKRKPISAADKKAIIALFKDADPTKYRLEFNKGREHYGTKKIEMADLEQIRKVTNPGEEQGWVVLIVVDDGAVYILAASHGDQSQLVQLLGREKVVKLNAIASKYAR